MKRNYLATDYRHDERFVLDGPLDESPPAQLRHALLATATVRAVTSVNKGSHCKRISFEPKWLGVVAAEASGTLSWSGEGVVRYYSRHVLTALIAIAWWTDSTSRVHVRVVGQHGSSLRGPRRSYRELDNPFARVKPLLAVYPEFCIFRPSECQRRDRPISGDEQKLVAVLSASPLDAKAWGELARLWHAAGAEDHAARAARVAAMLPDVEPSSAGDV
jgi:hypothetical protein